MNITKIVKFAFNDSPQTSTFIGAATGFVAGGPIGAVVGGAAGNALNDTLRKVFGVSLEELIAGTKRPAMRDFKAREIIQTAASGGLRGGVISAFVVSLLVATNPSTK